MPYRRKYRKSNKTNKYLQSKKGKVVKTSWPKTAFGVASKALSTAIMLKRLINVERKYFNPTVSATPGTSGSVTGTLLAIPQGDTALTRDGRSVRLNSFSLKGHCKINASSASSQLVRVMLIADVRAENTTPSATYVLQNLSVNSPLSDEVAGQFFVIRDWRFSLNKNGTDQYLFKYYSKMNKVLKFEDETTGAPENYNILLLLISDDAATPPSVEIETRTRFIDN